MYAELLETLSTNDRKALAAAGVPSPFSRPEAPEGYRWVLMLEKEAEAREQSRRG